MKCLKNGNYIFIRVCARAHRFCVRALKAVGTQASSLWKKAANCSALQRGVLVNLLPASDCFTVQETNCSFNYYKSITGKFFISTMHSTDPTQYFHCITVISFTKSMFSRLTSIVNNGYFIQHPAYEVVVACYWSLLLFPYYYFCSKNDTPQIVFSIFT